MAEAAEVAITQVIGENEEDVGAGLRRVGGLRNERQQCNAHGRAEEFAAGERHVGPM
jgi:hypothetical protein